MFMFDVKLLITTIIIITFRSSIYYNMYSQAVENMWYNLHVWQVNNSQRRKVNVDYIDAYYTFCRRVNVCCIIFTTNCNMTPICKTQPFVFKCVFLSRNIMHVKHTLTKNWKRVDRRGGERVGKICVTKFTNDVNGKFRYDNFNIKFTSDSDFVQMAFDINLKYIRIHLILLLTLLM